MKYPEEYRIKGNRKDNGVFIWCHRNNLAIFCMASVGEGWEHVSVSIKKIKGNKVTGESNRCPDWNEMCIVKNKFWNEEECIVQFHPPKSQYVSTHPYVLHLWKPIDFNIPTPEQILIGIPGSNNQRF